MDREEKIKFLKDLQAGKRTIAELKMRSVDLSNAEMWLCGYDENTSYENFKTGVVHTKKQHIAYLKRNGIREEDIIVFK